MRAVRILTATAATSLLVASLIHAGTLIEGYEHSEAAVAEGVIGAVMMVGLALTWARPPWGRRAAIGALLFGLAGTLVGVVMIAIGVGPQSLPDVVYHAALLAVLVAGLEVALLRPDPQKAGQR